MNENHIVDVDLNSNNPGYCVPKHKSSAHVERTKKRETHNSDRRCRSLETSHDARGNQMNEIKIKIHPSTLYSKVHIALSSKNIYIAEYEVC